MHAGFDAVSKRPCTISVDSGIALGAIEGEITFSEKFEVEAVQCNALHLLCLLACHLSKSFGTFSIECPL